TGAPEMEGKLRVGWLVNQWKEIAPDINQAVMAARQVLEKSPSIELSNATLPEGPWETAAGLVVSVEGATAFRTLIQSGRVAELNDPLGKIGGYMNEEISASDFILAQRIRAVLQKKMDGVFAEADVLVTASLPVTATTLSANLDDALSFPDPIGGIGNFCGLPAISVPCGFGSQGDTGWFAIRRSTTRRCQGGPGSAPVPVTNGLAHETPQTCLAHKGYTLVSGMCACAILYEGALKRTRTRAFLVA